MTDVETDLKAPTPADSYRLYAARLQLWGLCGSVVPAGGFLPGRSVLAAVVSPIGPIR